ncbi:MAG: glycosyltransferase [Candidatus Omnitrophica bacterium]|nr:glycosyltransferase [Candidatus Omnitrophota bacterium]
MEANPKVSVIIPTHNHALFLSKALDSVRNQTYEDYEVILVDNGSTDQTKELISKIKWEKLLYVYQDDTGSAAGPRNTGIRLAKGDYVAFLDSDDIWYKEKLNKVMDIFLKNPEIDLVCNDEYCRKDGKIVSYLKCGPSEPDMYEKLFFNGNRLSGSATVVKKAPLLKASGFDENKKYVHVEDYELWLRLAKLGCKFYFLNEPLGEFVLHDRNLSYEITKQMQNLRNVLIKHYFSYEKKMDPNYIYLFIKTYLKTYYSQLIRYKQGAKDRRN